MVDCASCMYCEEIYRMKNPCTPRLLCTRRFLPILQQKNQFRISTEPPILSDMRLLALDIGTRRTGIAYCDDTGVPLPLNTIEHESERALIDHIHDLIAARNIDHLIIGLPLLPSGAEGKQSKIVRSVGETLSAMVPVEYLDERYTTQDSYPDPDARAACALLTTFLERRKT